MATRQSVDEHLQQAVDAYEFAKDQYETGALQEHFNDTEFTKSLQMLEEAVIDLNKLSLSANAQQKDQVHRMRLQLQQLQNEMILLRR